MDTSEIQKRLDAMAAAMVAKGLRAPEATVDLISDVEPKVWLRWAKGAGPEWDKHLHLVVGETLAAGLDAGDECIRLMPSASETKRAVFMEALGNVIDLGRKNGIEVAFVNPLVETMKRLSENAITHRIAAE